MVKSYCSASVVVGWGKRPVSAYGASDPSIRDFHLVVGVDIEAVGPAGPVRGRVTGGGALHQVSRRILSLGRGGAPTEAAEQADGLEEEELSHGETGGEKTPQRANRNER